MLRPHRLVGVPAVCYSADVLCSMQQPPVADGAVLVDQDRVVAVGAASELRGRAARHHRVDGVLLPGLVDARCRLEAADVTLPDSGPYPTWHEAVTAPLAEWDSARVGRSAQRGVHGLLRAGTTCAGDVVVRGPGVPAASRAGLAGDSFIEIDGVDVRAQDEVLSALEHSLGLPAPGRRIGVALPGTQSVGAGVLQAVSDLVARHDTVLQLVAAASREEAKAVTDGAGPLARDLRVAGHQFEWLDGGSGRSPLAYAGACGALRAGWSVAHATKFRRGESEVLAQRGVAAVVSPRATPVLGRPRLAELAANSVRVALGSEGAPDPPDILAEAGAWLAAARSQGLETWPGHGGAPLPLPEAAVRLATVDGAAAMGWGEFAGALAPGRRADLVGVAVDTDVDDVYESLASGGAGRQVLTVLGGVRRARRADADAEWPEHELREEDTA